MSTNTLQQVKIEVWADLVCPWCGLGRHRLDAALEARRLGVTGVPFFVINDRYGISGAQRTELLLDALSRAWIELHG